MNYKHYFFNYFWLFKNNYKNIFNTKKSRQNSTSQAPMSQVESGEANESQIKLSALT